jgi:hypothetical protein
MWALANLIAGGPGTVYLDMGAQSSRLHQVTEDSFRHWGTADVSEADKHYTNHAYSKTTMKVMGNEHLGSRHDLYPDRKCSLVAGIALEHSLLQRPLPAPP